MSATRINVERLPRIRAQRVHDYCATFDGYDFGDLIGWGRSPDQAAASLIEQAVQAGGDEHALNALRVDEVVSC